MSETRVQVPPNAGESGEWGDWAILREPPPGAVVLDLTDVSFVDPFFLLRQRHDPRARCFERHRIIVAEQFMLVIHAMALREYVDRAA
jgi:hypothetical protein